MPDALMDTGKVGPHARTRPTDDAIPAMIERTRQAQAGWREVRLSVRLAVVRKLRRLIARDGESLAEAARREPRQLLAEKLVSEVIPLADACRFLEREAAEILAPRVLGRRGRPAWLAGVSAEVRREPFGVVLVIAPANYPLFLAGVQAIQALVAGNAVLWKPGRQGEASAHQLVGLLREAGLPEGLASVLPESTESAREAIELGVDKVILTGSAETGRAVLSDLAPRLIPSAVELSGCDAVFVRRGADLGLVCRALAFGLRLNRGETCLAPRRVFVDRGLAGELEGRLERLYATEAPIAVDAARADLAGSLVEEALSQGARRLVGRLPGEGADGPWIVADARPTMRIMREDSFAPVLALMPVRDDDEAIAASEACPYALGASIFGDPAGSEALAGRVRAGTVMVNDLIAPTADPRLPFGGVGRSGFGVTRGAEGLLEMTRVKVIARRRGGFYPHFDPLEAVDAEVALAYLGAAHGASWPARMASGARLAMHLIRKSRQAKGDSR